MKAESQRPHLRPYLRQGAFTLIEVMLALALFALAAVVLAGAYVNILMSLEAVKTDQSLEQEMAFVRTALLTEPDPDEVEKGGEVTTLTHGTATWRASIEPTLVADLFRVELTVEFSGVEGANSGAATEPETVSETLYLLRSDWSEPTDRDNLRAESRKRLEEIKRTRPL